jgi:hypothetical protein
MQPEKRVSINANPLPLLLCYTQLLCLVLIVANLQRGMRDNEPSYSKRMLFSIAITFGWLFDMVAILSCLKLTQQAMAENNFLYKDACGEQLNNSGFNQNSAWQIVPAFQAVLTGTHLLGAFKGTGCSCKGSSFDNIMRELFGNGTIDKLCQPVVIDPEDPKKSSVPTLKNNA